MWWSLIIPLKIKVKHYTVDIILQVFEEWNIYFLYNLFIFMIDDLTWM